MQNLQISKFFTPHLNDNIRIQKLIIITNIYYLSEEVNG